MKKFFAIIVFCLCFLSPSQANDIKDFQIAGISLGDSLLKFVDKGTILSSRKYNYKDDEFYSVDIIKKFDQYNGIQFHLKKGDNKYTIHGLSGALIFGETSEYYPQSEKECKKTKATIENEMKKLFKNAETYSQNFVGQKNYDPEAVRQETYFILNNGEVWLQCVTWGKKAKKKHNIMDNLRVSILTKEFQNWMSTKAY